MMQTLIPATTLLHACTLVMPQWPARHTAYRALATIDHGDRAIEGYYQSINTHASAEHRDSTANFLRMACAIARAGDTTLTVVIQSR